MSHHASRFYRQFLKRGFDVLAVLPAIPFIIMIVGILALLVKCSSNGPVFYRQDRLGRNGKIFQIWKLRSMIMNADQTLTEYLSNNPTALAEWTETQKLKNDPRVTAIGRVIRKISLDELPQLWNVLTGDMSLVGPRPMMPEQASFYTGRNYYNLRPGLTGYWQVFGRNATSFSARAAYDNLYNRRLSFMTDTLVLIMTVRTVLRGTGY